MVIRFKEAGAAALVLVALGLGYRAFGPGAETVETAAVRLDSGVEVPAIGLDRLSRKGADAPIPAPSRDVFAYGRPVLSALPTPVINLQPVVRATPVPTPELPPTPTPWPLLNITLIGIVD